MSDPPSPQAFMFSNGDKILHSIAFGITGAAAAFGALIRRRYFGLFTFLEAWILTGFYGFLDELHQYFTPLRTPDILDWLADITGAAIGIGLLYAIFYTISFTAFHWLRQPSVKLDRRTKTSRSTRIFR